MDGISAASAISGLCFTSGQLLVGFFEYIKDVQDVPKEVSGLTTELCALNTALMGLKGLITSREGAAQQDVLLALARDSTIALENCKETMQQIEAMVKKSKIKTRQSANGQLIKCTRWLWNKKEVALLRDKVEGWKGTISLMLQISSGHGQDEAAALLEKIHQSVSKLEMDRQHVKETLVVMDKDHRQYDDAEFSVNIKPLAKPPVAESSHAPTSAPFRPFNKALVDAIQSQVWTGVKVRCKSAPWQDVSCLGDSAIKLVIAPNFTGYIKIRLSRGSYEALKHRCTLARGRAFKASYEGGRGSGYDRRRSTADNGPSTTIVRRAEPVSYPNTLVGSFLRAIAPREAINSTNTTTTNLSQGYRYPDYAPLYVDLAPAPVPSPTPSLAAGDIFPPFLIGLENRTGLLDFIFCSIGRSGRRIVIKPGDRLALAHNGEVELTLATVEDAARIFDLLREVQLELESSWELYVQSFANIDRTLAAAQVGGNLRGKAADEYASKGMEGIWLDQWE